LRNNGDLKAFSNVAVFTFSNESLNIVLKCSHAILSPIDFCLHDSELSQEIQEPKMYGRSAQTIHEFSPETPVPLLDSANERDSRKRNPPQRVLEAGGDAPLAKTNH
jgi:hypothetical protein